MNQKIILIQSEFNASFEFIRGINVFKFSKGKIKFKLLIRNFNKLYKAKLFVEDFNNFLNINDSHVEQDGRACTCLFEKALSLKDFCNQINSWIKLFIERVNGSYHSSGFRHGFPGIVEEYFSKKNLTLNSVNVQHVKEEELFALAKRNRAYKNSSIASLREEWKYIKENWNEEMV